MKEELVVILNPAAGGGRCEARVAPALLALREAGRRVRVHHTEAPSHGIELAAQARREGHHTLIAAGGDGTAWEVVSGIMRADHPSTGPSTDPFTDRSARPAVARLGFLPAGTGNSYLRDFSGSSLEDCVQAILDEAAHPSDVIRIDTGHEPLWSLNLVSLGFVADICREANDRYKRFGQGAYVLGLLRTLARLRPARWRMREDGGPWRDVEGTFLSMNNSRFTGGAMCMAPDARVDDGRMDLIEVGPFGRAELLATFPRIFRGTHVAHPRISSRQVVRLEFEGCTEIELMIDGEVVSSPLRAMQIVPGAVEVLAYE